MLKPAVLELGGRFRAIRGLYKRGALPDVHELDTGLMREALRAAQAQHLPMIRRVAMDGLWTARRTVHVCRESDQCLWCGAESEDTAHVLWSCPSSDRVRDSVLPDHRRLKEILPEALKLFGWPPQAVISVDGGVFWGGAASQEVERANWSLPPP
eukprot:1684797-Alexandrium_andersonii.AAC.1